ncbi:hypothetical protein F-S17_0013 [Faustovirus]|nr:hypothetical protein F-LCD7_0028 [Faustovirus]QJX71791.1 hypothetical protein F-M6_0028 [Faustovirus]QJX72279.1 hypothetical protein F-S17_0013 [Faustovirus]QJX72789.1 hypothetical protein F-VV57_0027 [Faustovirus]QJX73294.1 hypothetical protein F-VV63_0028 [Faustovirus]
MEAITTRAKLVNGNFNLPTETINAMREIREACSELATRLEAIVKADGAQFDTGRMIAAMDLVQQVKDTACVAVILPHAK